MGVGYGIAGSTSEPAEDSEPEEPPASNPQTDPVQPEEDVEAENSNPEEIQIVEPLPEQVEEEAENASERALEVDYLPSYVGGVHDFQYSVWQFKKMLKSEKMPRFPGHWPLYGKFTM